MLCKKCGAQIEDDAKECVFCGEKFAQGAEVTVENTPVEVDSAVETIVADERSTHEIFEENERKKRQQTEEIVVDEKTQQLNEINERRELKKKKQKRNKIMLVAALCIVIAGVAAGGAYYLKKDINRGEVVTVTPTPIPTPKVTPTPDQTAQPSESPQATQNTQGQAATSNNGVVTGPVKVTTTRKPVSEATPAKTQSPQTAKPATQASSGASIKGTNAKTYKTPQKQSGALDTAIVSELVVGGEVIDDGTTKNPVMTFTMNNATYYAYVSKGSWTEFINGKYMTISAVATPQKYKGNTIYDISKLVYYTGEDYIIADSGVRLLSESELKGYSKNQLALARNEIFARHGRRFDTKEYSDYFTAKSWYKLNDNYDYSTEVNNINDIERKNVDTIKSVEISK